MPEDEATTNICAATQNGYCLVKYFINYCLSGNVSLPDVNSCTVYIILLYHTLTLLGAYHL